MIEEFFKAYQNIIQAIAAAGTVGAVVTSLWLAWRAKRADRTRLRARADMVAHLPCAHRRDSCPEVLEGEHHEHRKVPPAHPVRVLLLEGAVEARGHASSSPRSHRLFPHPAAALPERNLAKSISGLHHLGRRHVRAGGQEDARSRQLR
jgi:hypothetical protein